MPQYIPIMLRVDGERALVVGGGEVALRKAKELKEAGARVLAVSESFCEGFSSGEFELLRSRAEGESLMDLIKRSRIVVAATDDKEFNRRIMDMCKETGALCNVVDYRESPVIFPATYREGSVVLSVSTSGEVPHFAKFLRDVAALAIRPYLRGFNLIKRIREALMGMDYRKRERALNAVTSSRNFWEAVWKGDEDRAMRAAMDAVKGLNDQGPVDKVHEP